MAEQELRELDFTADDVPPALRFRRALARGCGKEDRGSAAAHIGCGRFVEHHLPRQEIGAVKELVNDHAGQFHSIKRQQVGEQRIVEPAERRERDHRPHQRVVSA